MFAVRLTRSLHGFEQGDSILAHPALGPSFALVRLIPARYARILELDNLNCIEYVSGALWPADVTRLLESHFAQLRAESRQILRLCP